MFETLSNYGITQGMVQAGIFFCIIAFVVGCFWQYLLIGGGILACVIILFLPYDTVAKKSNTVTIESKDDDVPAAYIQDCLSLTNKSKDGCVALWREREIEESKL